MRIEIYQAPFEQTALGFRADADYQRVWEAEIATLGMPSRAHLAGVSREEWEKRYAVTDATEILERIFRDFQRVDPEKGPWPPEGYTGRSLSIGDVVVLDGWAPFAVEWSGFAVAKGFS